MSHRAQAPSKNAPASLNSNRESPRVRAPQAEAPAGKSFGKPECQPVAAEPSNAGTPRIKRERPDKQVRPFRTLRAENERAETTRKRITVSSDPESHQNWGHLREGDGIDRVSGQSGLRAGANPGNTVSEGTNEAV